MNSALSRIAGGLALAFMLTVFPGCNSFARGVAVWDALLAPFAFVIGFLNSLNS